MPQPAIDFANLDLNLLKVFDILMQERNLTRAAERLNKSTGATSNALKRLREELHDELFETPGRGMVPTRRAHEIAPFVSAALGQLRSGLSAEPIFDPPTARRIFTIDIPVGADFLIAPTLVAHAAKQAPNVTFNIMSDRATVLRSELRYGETEVSIDHEIVESDGLRYKLLYSDRFMLLARKNHPKLQKGKGVPAELYSELQHVGLSWTRTKGDSPVVARLTKIGIERRYGIMVPTLGSIPAIIESSDLVASMSERVGRNFARRWNIELHPFAFQMVPVPIYLVWHERFNDDPGHIWLRDAIQHACDNI